MYRFINEHCDLAITKLGAIDPRDYLELCKRMQSDVNATSDMQFQRRYRNYWRMNVARLGEGFYKRYFELLAECQQSRSIDIPRLAKELRATTKKRSLQFSFATKLAHMVDPRIPVYDSFVAAFYFYEPPAGSFGKRLKELMKFHDFLRGEYERVIREGLLNQAIRKFRDRYPPCDSLCNERIIDWLIWSCVSLLQDKVKEGAAIYQ